MLEVAKTLGTSIHEGKIRVRFLGEDQKEHDVLLPLLPAVQTVAEILQASRSLPPNPNARVEGVVIQGAVSLAIGNKMQPLLTLSLNGMEIALPLSEAQLTALRDDMSHLLRQLQTPH